MEIFIKNQKEMDRFGIFIESSAREEMLFRELGSTKFKRQKIFSGQQRRRMVANTVRRRSRFCQAVAKNPGRRRNIFSP
jgi:hypothetical protein